MKRHFVIEIEVGETEEGWNAADAIIREIEDDVMGEWNGLVKIIHPTTSMSKGRERYVGWTREEDARYLSNLDDPYPTYRNDD